MIAKTRLMALRLLISATLIVTCSPANAQYDWTVDAHVTTIEPTYVAWTNLYFAVDQAGGTSCPVGTWLRWNTLGVDETHKIANVQAILSVLLSAKLSGKRVRVYGNNADCSIGYLHFID